MGHIHGYRPQAVIIEDNIDLATVFGMALEEAGFAASIIYDGGIALEKIGGLAPDIVVLDLHLPQVSGAEILKYIKSDSELMHAYVIIISADPHTAVLFEHDVDIVLIKPVAYHQIRDLSMRFAKQLA